jgi:spermidine synthase
MLEHGTIVVEGAPMKVRRALFLSLVFASGAAGLTYQMVWFRQLRLVFGLSTAAHAAVLAVFLGGLGLGGVLLGRRADRHPRPMVLYGTLEISVALAAAATPLLLRVARSLYLMTGGEAAIGFVGATLVRGIVTVLVLAVPTVLLGGTLPALIRSFETDDDPERRKTAIAYGINTLGGVVGVCLATFVLIEILGEVTTILLAACVSATVGVIARRLGGHESVNAVADGPSPGVHDDRFPAVNPALVLAAAAATGFVFFLMELVWYRMLAPILGGTTFTFGVILAVALLGIAAGGGLYALVAAGRRATPAAFATTLALEGVAMAVPLALGDRIALLAAFSGDFSGLGFGGSLTAWFAIACLVVLPASTVAGFQFPLLVALLGSGREGVGRHVGLAYACNTLGSIAGAILGGFVLLTWLGAVSCWRLSVVMCLALSAVVVVASMVQPRSTARRLTAGAIGLPLALVAAGGVMVNAVGPTAVWRHAGIGAGRSTVDGRDLNGVQRFIHSQRRQLLWEADGRESSVGLEASDGFAFVLNGKIDGNSVNDAGTQVMSGLLGALIHRDPRMVLVVGLGTGSTAGWLADVPAVEHVRVIELEPEIRYVAEVCEPVNRSVLTNPKVSIAYGDAREALLTTKDRFDMVVSEPSNPYRAGIASLFTADFYRHVSDRLNDQGLFLQWFQGYEVDTKTVAVVVNTLASVFPEVQVWRTLKNDLLLVASNSPIEIDIEVLKGRIAREPFASAMRAAWQTSSVEGVLARCVAGPSLAAAVREGGMTPVNTDDRNLLEFMLAKSVGSFGHFRVETMLEAAREMGAERPPLAVGSPAPDWELVERERIGAFIEPPDDRRPAFEPLFEFHRLWRRGDAHAAVDVWKSSGFVPLTDAERIGLASGLSAIGDPAAEKILADLAGSYPTETALLNGKLWLVRGDPQTAFDSFRLATESLVSQPWVHPAVFSSYFSDLDRIAGSGPALARGVFELLGSPLAVERARDERQWARLRVAALVDSRAFDEALEGVEPWVPWDLWLLQRRAQVRVRQRSPAAAAAVADAVKFGRNAPVPFNAIPMRPQQGVTPTRENDNREKPGQLEIVARSAADGAAVLGTEHHGG